VLATRLATIAAGAAVCLSLLIAPAATAAPTPDPTTSTTAPPTAAATLDPSASPEPTPTDPTSPTPTPTPTPTLEVTPSPDASASPEPSIPTPAPSGSLAATQAAAAYSALTVEALAAVVGFQAGNIVSDSVFTNKNTMTASGIDAFFRKMVTSCQSGYTCLKDYRQNTPSRAADSYCSGYQGGTNESAATIIYKVAQSCNVNPQVIIVMLQKEQGLITHTWPSQWRYDMALGQGCPDTAPCDPAFAGFFYQIYGAARQMNIYMEGRYFTYYPVGRTSNIYWHPNASCGTGPVYISNKSTAALYYYTPYQPNAAALAAGFGEGDGCSAYGNRNFYNYFKLWFGDPTSGGGTNPSPEAITTYWNANGGAAGWIGAATGDLRSWGSAGAWQTFRNADLYARADGTVYAVQGATRTEYNAVAGPSSGLGWPTTERTAISGGYYQDFGGGRIYERNGQAFAVAAPMFAVHEGLGNVFGRFGWPTSRATAVGAGAVQKFQGGSIYQASRTSNGSTYALSSPWVTWYNGVGGPTGSFGFPRGGESAVAATTVQVPFAGGYAFRTGSSTVTVTGAIRTEYDRRGAVTGTLGVPSGTPRTSGDGTYQDFAGGRIAIQGGVTSTISRALAKTWDGLGGPKGRMGWPIVTPYTVSGVSVVEFAGGVMFHKPSSAQAYAVFGVSVRTYRQAGGTPVLGAPTGAEKKLSAGYMQTFEKGVIFVPFNGISSAVAGEQFAAYTKGGSLNGFGFALGPAAPLGAGKVQPFEVGSIATSASGTAAVRGTMRIVHQNAGGYTGPLGFPVAAERKVSTGYVQDFQGGSAYVSPVALAVTRGVLHREYLARGGAAGSLGFPLGNETSGNGQWSQRFQKGTITLYADGRVVVR